MFEFIDLELIKMNVIAVFIALIIIATLKNTLRALAIIFSILLLFDFSYLYYMNDTAKENIESFKKAKVLQCMQVDPIYRVSLEAKWMVDGNYFIKDSLMIRADKCEILK